MFSLKKNMQNNGIKWIHSCNIKSMYNVHLMVCGLVKRIPSLNKIIFSGLVVVVLMSLICYCHYLSIVWTFTFSLTPNLLKFCGALLWLKLGKEKPTKDLIKLKIFSKQDFEDESWTVKLLNREKSTMCNKTLGNIGVLCI